MNQCVPSWDLDDTPNPPKLTLGLNSNSLAPDVPTLDYEVAELTWENGQLAMHGLGKPRIVSKPTAENTCPSNYTWNKPLAGGTLESIVNQATRVPFEKVPSVVDGGDDRVPWFERQRQAVAATVSVSGTMTLDALVPCSSIPASRNDDRAPSIHMLKGVHCGNIGPCVMGSSTHVGSCGDTATFGNVPNVSGVASATEAPTQDWSSMGDQSVSGSASFDRDSRRRLSIDTCDKILGVEGYTSTSMGSPENTSSADQCTKAAAPATTDDLDSVCHSRSQRVTGDEEDNKKPTGKSSASTRRSRAAAIHNQSERKRRDKINQKMKTLQKLVPNSSKTDKASMLDEVIEYLKQLQAQVNMMNRINLSPMMLSMAMQQQLQMSMMAPVGVGMGMGMGMGLGLGFGVMDMNSIGRPNLNGIPQVLQPAAFMPAASWPDSTCVDQIPLIPDPLMSTFLACQSQPMPMDAYARMAALYQQFQQPPGSKN